MQRAPLRALAAAQRPRAPSLLDAGADCSVMRPKTRIEKERYFPAVWLGPSDCYIGQGRGQRQGYEHPGVGRAVQEGKGRAS